MADNNIKTNEEEINDGYVYTPEQTKEIAKRLKGL
jgi:hypothetical protein